MRIAIVTLPLHTNYGGILQAYALKTYLESLGHQVTVLDHEVKMPFPPLWKAPFVYAKRAVQRIVKGQAGPVVFRELRFRRDFPVISANTQKFVDDLISPRLIKRYKDIKEGEYDAFVVGSDQVWRPRYFGRIEDAFLAFAKDWDVLRVAYAASFGTDHLEYEYMQVQECASLLETFDGVSVREDAGVLMCREWFDCEKAVQVLDPVMLLDRSVYEHIASRLTGHPAKGKVVSYILDPSKEKKTVLDFMLRVSGLQHYDLSTRSEDLTRPVSERVVPPLEEWLAGFADAGYVVTDSFHGCVLSILFHKPFVAVGNSRRGMSRLQSLLSQFDLDMRLVHGIDPEDDGEFFLSPPDWGAVDAILETERDKSRRFLMDSLHK